MKLEKALRRLLWMAGNDDQIVMVPASVATDERPRVGFQNSQLGMSIGVDEVLPYRALPVDALSKLLLPAPASAAVEIEEGSGYGFLRVTAGLATKEITSKPGSDSPLFPEPPRTGWRYCPDWPAVLAIAGFCGPSWMGSLAGVRVAPDRVEATDTTVFTQARVALGFEGTHIIPKDIFSRWPTGDVALAIDGGRFYARVGEEKRWATLLPPGKFPDTNLIPEVHPYVSMSVDTERLAQAVQQVKKLGSVQGVRVHAGASGLTLAVAGEPPPLSIDLPCEPPGVPMDIWVSGKVLASLIKAIRTPRVGVCLGPAGSPLRLDSGPLVLCLWPLLVG
jgi:hypothetical protein